MSYAPPSRRRDEDEEFQQPFTSTGRVGGSFVAPPTVPQQEPDFSTADFSAAFGDLNQPQQSEPDFSTADFGAAFADLAPAQPSAPAQREPVEQPQGWGFLDNLDLMGRAVPESIVNAIPWFDPLIVTDYEAAPAPTALGAFGRASNVAQDIGAGVGEWATGLIAGPAGVPVTAGGSSLLRSIERNETDALREYMAANPEASIEDARIAIMSEDGGVKPLDTGDFAVAGIDAALANPALKVGRWGGDLLFNNPTLRGAAKSVAGVGAFDFGTGLVQGAADVINQEDAMPGQWTGTVQENFPEILQGAAFNAAVSGGLQGVDFASGVGARRRAQNDALTDRLWSESGIDPQRIAELEAELAADTTDLNFAGIDIANDVFRADTNRLMAESQARSQADIDATVQAQNERLVRDFQTQREAQLQADYDTDMQARFREYQEAQYDAQADAVAFDEANRIAATRDLVEAERAAVAQAQLVQSIRDLDRSRGGKGEIRERATPEGQIKAPIQIGYTPDRTRLPDGGGILVDPNARQADAFSAPEPQSRPTQRPLPENPKTQAAREAQEFRDSLMRRPEPQPEATPQPEVGQRLSDDGGRMLDGDGLRPMRESDVPVGFVPRTEDVLPTNLAPDANAPQMPGRPVGGQSPQPNAQNPARATQASSAANEPDFSTADPAVAFGDLPENQRMDARQPSRMESSAATAEAPAGNRRPVSGLDNFRPKMPEIDRDQYGDIASSDPKQRNAVLDRIRQGGNHPLAPVEGLSQTKPVPGLLESLEGVGAAQRDADGNLPKRMGAINLEKFAGDDEATQNLLAGVIRTNEDQIEADRIREGGVLERASRIHKYNDIRNVEAIGQNQPLPDAEAAALDAATMGAAAQVRNSSSMENALDFGKRVAASNRVASAQGAALGARNILRRAMLNQLPSFERGLISMADEMLKGGRKDVPEWALKRMMDIKDKDDLTEIVTTLQGIKRKDQGFLGWLGGRYRYSNMLSSPITAGRTVGGNLTNLIFKGMVSPITGRAVDSLLPQSGRIYASGENRAAIAGVIAGSRDAWDKAVTVLGKGYKLQDLRDLDYKNLRTESRGGAANPMNLPARVMQTLDEFTSTMAENMQRFRLAHRKAHFEGKGEGLTGTDLDKYIVDNVDRIINSDVEIDRAAKEFAKTMTHMEDAIATMPAISKNLPRGVREVLNLALNLNIPFWRTLVNMGKEGAILSGAGFGTAIPSVARKVLPKGRTLDLIESLTEGMTPQQKRERFLQAAMGTASMALLTSYALEGKLTGEAPSDPRERERWYGEGNRPFTIDIGGKPWDYTKFGPLYYPLSLSAGIAKAIKQKELNPESNVALLAAANAMGTFTELPIFAGLGSLMEATQSPVAMERFASNIASQFVPLVSAQRWVNRQGWTGTTIPEANTMSERLVASTVVGRSVLPAKLSGYGEELNVRNPKDPLYVELSRLDMLPPSIPRDITIGGERYPLEPEERRTILRAAELSAEMLRGVIETPSWNVLTDAEKRQYIDLFHKDIVQELRRVGRAKVTPAVIERTKEERQNRNAPQQPGTAVGER